MDRTEPQDSPELHDVWHLILSFGGGVQRFLVF